MSRVLSIAAVAVVVATFVAAHNDEMSRHFIAQDVPATDVVMVAETTEGPYFESESAYIASANMTAAAVAGSPGVTADRASVLNGVKLALTLNIYTVAGSTAVELSGADVLLWECDALGRYSSVDSARQRSEDTSGQKWLRGKQTTGTDGTVTFNTIFPGWYVGRTIHFHLRIRFTAATSFAVTSQLFVSDAFLNSYKTLAPYSGNTGAITTLAADSIYSAISSAIATKLVLNPVGSVATGYTATVNVGIATSTTTTATTTAAPGSSSSTSATTATSVSGSATATTTASVSQVTGASETVTVTSTGGATPPPPPSPSSTTAAGDDAAAPPPDATFPVSAVGAAHHSLSALWLTMTTMAVCLGINATF